LHHPQRGAIGHDPNVAGQRDLGPAAKRRTLDGGDGRNREVFQTVERLGHHRRQAYPVQSSRVAVELKQIAAGALPPSPQTIRRPSRGLMSLVDGTKDSIAAQESIARRRTMDRDLSILRSTTGPQPIASLTP
jgi:hypothetical protein